MIKLSTVFAIAFLIFAPNRIYCQFNYSDFSSISGLNLVVNAAQFENKLRLTPAANSQRGAAWYTTKQLIQDGFESTFQFQLNGGADGFAFVIQNFDEGAISTGSGGSIGYNGIPNSLAVEFDTYRNFPEGDPNGNHISIHTRGLLPNSVSHTYSLGSTTNIPDLNNGSIYTSKIIYESNLLEVYLNDLNNPVLTVNIDISNNLDLDAGKAWIGFTASTGSFNQNHDLISWSFEPPIINIVTPNGGENWQVDGTYDITWNYSNVSDVKIDYTTDDGINWLPITPSTPSDGSYSWTVENNPSTQCKVKISDVTNSSIYDESDETFTISSLNTIIITHGATFQGTLQQISNSRWEHYVWQFAMADAVSDNRDIYLIRKGKAFKIEASYNRFKKFTEDYGDLSIEDVIDSLEVPFTSINPLKDNVFIFDWTLESFINSHGYAEAAADLLAATLVNLGKDHPFLLNNLHFIGHSRGTVVNSETIQRLYYLASNDMLPNIIELDPEIHMTTLDAHPAGHWGKWWPFTNILIRMDDDKVNSSNIKQGLSRIGVVGWKADNNLKVSYIDNYYQNHYITNLFFIGLSDFPGLDNTNVIANNNLTSIISGDLNAHKKVHTWYHGTTNLNDTHDEFGTGFEILRSSWYSDGLGLEQGFYYSRNRNGYLSDIQSIEEELIDVNSDYNYGREKLIFNGDFSKSKNDSIPGWSFQGGKSAGLAPIFERAQLNDDNNILIHNTLFIPDNKDYLWFRYRVSKKSDIDVLKISFFDEFNQVEGSLNLTKYMRPLKYDWAKILIPIEFKGKAAKIKFELTKIDADDTEVFLDDICFDEVNRIASIVICPVDFHIYDHLGNHTGPINDSTYVEEIPGSEYHIYEDSTGGRIKTVYLKPLNELGEYSFVIESRDTTSFFTFIIEDYSDTSRETVTFSFDSIAIEPNTVATCTLNTTQIPTLAVDIDGDGETDTTYTPEIIGFELINTVLIGWNMISLPLELSDAYYKTLYPTSVDNTLYGFNGSYFSTDTIKTEKGYWLKIASPDTVNINGIEILNMNINLNSGWNMIGGPNCDVLLGSVVDPGGIIIPGTLFGYAGGYFSATTIDATKGYWIKTNAPGTITISCGAPLAKGGNDLTIPLEILTAFVKIDISDANNKGQILYFNGKLDEGISIESFSMPPVSPKGSFDARLAGDYRLSESEEVLVEIQSSSYPLKVKIEGKGHEYIVKQLIGPNEIDERIVASGEEITISNSKVNKLRILKGSLIPTEFVLHQNYPNPFNPVTKIKYGIPKTERVELTIFNVLGEQIVTLVNQEQEAGYYTVEWSGNNVSSGVYLYTLKAGDNFSVKKMILLK